MPKDQPTWHRGRASASRFCRYVLRGSLRSKIKCATSFAGEVVFVVSVAASTVQAKTEFNSLEPNNAVSGGGQLMHGEAIDTINNVDHAISFTVGSVGTFLGSVSLRSAFPIRAAQAPARWTSSLGQTPPAFQERR